MSTNSSQPTCDFIEANPDVTGTGIRVSIYVLCLAAGILKSIIHHITSAENYAEFCQALNSALQLQGLALLCTAIVQTIEQQLTLFHALCVLHLLSLLGFGLVAQRKYEGGGFYRWLVLAFLRVIIACAFVALTAYIWLTAPTFGSQPECNADTIYVVFGVSINATNDVFRYVFLALMASMAVGWVFSMVFAVFFASCCCGGARKSAKRLRDGNPDVAVLKNVWARVRVSDPRASGSVVSGQIVQMLVHTGINIYMIVTLEQIVERNKIDKNEESAWTFGQILALFVLLGVVVEVINILLPKLDRVAEADSEDDEAIELSNRLEPGRQARLLGPGSTV
ncbi:hypothetical protein AB5N19_01758 [Seiridium cardinale]|uniref:Uncharacterized protein n=1 Tax=Seiridium cardinale TaxID=138064 RepID=A0ABR2XB39_9PEZI